MKKKKNAWVRYWIRVDESFVGSEEGWVKKSYYILVIIGALLASGFLSDDFLDKSLEFARGLLGIVGATILVITYVGSFFYAFFFVISMIIALFKK